MKIILGIFLLLLSTFLGYIFSLKYEERYSYYNSFFEFNKKLKTEVLFSHETLISLINNSNKNNLFYKVIQKKLIDKSQIKLEFLNKDDLSFIDDYVSNIGTSDSVSQIKYIESIEEKLYDKVFKCENDLKKYKPLFIKMGFLFGLIFLIIIL